MLGKFIESHWEQLSILSQCSVLEPMRKMEVKSAPSKSKTNANLSLHSTRLGSDLLCSDPQMKTFQRHLTDASRRVVAFAVAQIFTYILSYSRWIYRDIKDVEKKVRGWRFN